MKKWSYYNDVDPFVCAWAKELIKRGLVAPGVVDCRSITEISPDDLKEFVQCHFFCGILGWSYALRLAGIPDDRPVWTGSCPCQPFSVAGAQRGSADERHLWPAFFNLIRECKPASVFGEQVAGAAGYAWWDHVAADLEGEGYAAAAADIGAHSVGAPHIRQRLYWVAHSDGGHASAEREQCGGQQRQQQEDGGADCIDMGNANNTGPQGRIAYAKRTGELAVRPAGMDCWSDIEWIECIDGKYRPVGAGIFPLAARLPKGLVRGGDRSLAPDANESSEARVMRLRGYGNAIVPQLAAAFVRAAFGYTG
ncbi:MAG: DNA cytosine methyltransferase [Rhizobiales bacterium]|nr:DNA cytosine methyltransferase [Hyphomicrobiales bacterium]